MGQTMHGLASRDEMAVAVATLYQLMPTASTYYRQCAATCHIWVSAKIWIDNTIGNAPVVHPCWGKASKRSSLCMLWNCFYSLRTWAAIESSFRYEWLTLASPIPLPSYSMRPQMSKIINILSRIPSTGGFEFELDVPCVGALLRAASQRYSLFLEYINLSYLNPVWFRLEINPQISTLRSLSSSTFPVRPSYLIVAWDMETCKVLTRRVWPDWSSSKKTSHLCLISLLSPTVARDACRLWYRGTRRNRLSYQGVHSPLPCQGLGNIQILRGNQQHLEVRVQPLHHSLRTQQHTKGNQRGGLGLGLGLGQTHPQNQPLVQELTLV